MMTARLQTQPPYQQLAKKVQLLMYWSLWRELSCQDLCPQSQRSMQPQSSAPRDSVPNPGVMLQPQGQVPPPTRPPLARLPPARLPPAKPPLARPPPARPPLAREVERLLDAALARMQSMVQGLRRACKGVPLASAGGICFLHCPPRCNEPTAIALYVQITLQILLPSRSMFWTTALSQLSHVDDHMLRMQHQLSHTNAEAAPTPCMVC